MTAEPHGEVREHDLELPDGRTLHVYDAGPVAGLPVIWHHGTPNVGSPLELLFGVAEEVGVRWVSFDRPGYGGSTPHPGRTIGSIASDVAALADSLGLDRFGVLGYSGGGPHALACAAIMPDRVVAILVIGAAGGVGSMTVLLVKYFGATVTGVCSTAKVDFVLSLGAEDVIDYKNSPLLGTYDAIIDTAGGRNLDVLRRRLTPKGRLVMVGAEGVGKILGLMKRMLRAAVYTPFVSQKLITLMAKENPDDLATIRDLLASGAITVPIERTFPLAKAANAIRHLEAGMARGKVVVTVA